MRLAFRRSSYLDGYRNALIGGRVGITHRLKSLYERRLSRSLSATLDAITPNHCGGLLANHPARQGLNPAISVQQQNSLGIRRREAGFRRIESGEPLVSRVFRTERDERTRRYTKSKNPLGVESHTRGITMTPYRIDLVDVLKTPISQRTTGAPASMPTSSITSRTAAARCDSVS